LLHDADATLAKNGPDMWGGMCRAHLDYDKALFLNMDPEDQARMSQRFASARKEAGKDLWNAAPGTSRHEQAEAAWNAACREQQAQRGEVWTERFDRRHEFHCHQQGPGPLNRAGNSSLQVTIRGRFHDPTNTINWFVEEPSFSERPEGKMLFDRERAAGKACLVPPEFGIDPREKLNYDHRAAEPGYALHLQSSLVRAAGPGKEGAELASVDVEINLRSITNRQSVRIDFPPQVRACPGGGPLPTPAAAREVGSENGCAPVPLTPAAPAAEPAGPKRAAPSAGCPAHSIAPPGGSGI
jgi:hypothetical protein